MKKHTILVPTDFSENAWTALYYASTLAKEYHWELHILHTYNNLNFSSIKETFLEMEGLKEKENLDLKMKELSTRLENVFPSLKARTSCMFGDLSKIILDLLQDQDYRLVIMGTKGSGWAKSRTIGSNTYDIIKSSPIGVLAVPQGYNAFKLNKLGLLTNFKKSEISLLQSFMERIERPFEISLLHVTERDRPVENQQIAFWKDQIYQSVAIKDIEYIEKEAVNRLDYHMPIPNCINWMIDKLDVDLLLVSYNRKSFFRELFSKSLPRSIAHNLNIPTYFKSNND